MKRGRGRPKKYLTDEDRKRAIKESKLLKQEVKRGRGRPPKYSTEEDRKRAINEYKTAYMLNREWFCDVCNNQKNYTLAGKWSHIKTNKHQNNSYKGIKMKKKHLIQFERFIYWII